MPCPRGSGAARDGPPSPARTDPRRGRRARRSRAGIGRRHSCSGRPRLASGDGCASGRGDGAGHGAAMAAGRAARRRSPAQLRGGIRVALLPGLRRPVHGRRRHGGGAVRRPEIRRRARRHRKPARAGRDRDRGRRDRPGDVLVPRRARLAERDHRADGRPVPARPGTDDGVRERPAAAEHRLGERALHNRGAALQRRRRPPAASLPDRRPRVAGRAAAQGRRHRPARPRLAPDPPPRRELSRVDDAPVRLAGGAPPSARRMPGDVLGPAAPRQHRPSDAVGLADRPRRPARAHGREGGRPVRHRRVPDDAGAGAGAAHHVAGEHAAAPACGLLPRPGLGGLPARRDPVAERLPGRRPGSRLLRLSAGALGRPAPLPR